MNNFDIFRLNCFLNDIQGTDFKNIIISLVSEYIFDKDNKSVTYNECYLHVINFHKLEIDRDYFNEIIAGSKNFEETALHSDITLKLTPEKYNKIHSDLNDHNIDHYINLFLRERNLKQNYLASIKSLIFKAVYDNIHTFSTNNLNTLISENLKKEFKNDEIQAFNDFLDYENYKKNSALYNIFLKATEFAIVTSGKGVKYLSKDIFRGKKYCLDTNIILRLLGVGGDERRNTLIKLLKSCVHQGIIFEYTGQTYQELKRTLSSNVKYLKYAENKYDLKKLGELAESEGQLINDDFITHYSKEKIRGKIGNPDQYEVYMLSQLRKLENEISFSVSKGNLVINEKEKSRLSNYLHKERKDLPYGRNYTKTAANIDAQNILFVRSLRGGNNYNYVDVKSFYLTTDRTLNDILSKDNKEEIIPETILPSQLFILHNPYMSNGEEVDYDLFLQFVKRRTTEHSFKGGEVLTYINEIRKSTASDAELKNILYVYADKRYDTAKEGRHENKRALIPIKEIIETVLDKKLAEGQKAKDNLSVILSKAEKEIPIFHVRSRNYVRVLDILLIILIIPIIILLLKLFFDYPFLIIIL